MWGEKRASETRNLEDGRRSPLYETGIQASGRGVETVRRQWTRHDRVQRPYKYRGNTVV